ncbi:Uracil-DNA glycosylase, family 4 [Acidithiobacillus ferrivorans]|uniref:Uracil-DNA glycosylase, family 4 n=1 Tax=Acidithiobacillus ferrivorans TaxID=160808 RepID=A0A060UQL9_9PROT|nr:uracil-DNA glycosylase [Acidithiobacillus ferrivorans]CDQ10556.1 Uracil-DNA glycosylase, family 4 [Acidithiobacillus ferrivorans]SMH64587.1 Uracil-DNA glycosylase, family 4 [Acidithiobacillus ferrivorans]
MTCTKCQSLCASRTQIVEPDLPEFGRHCLVLVVGEAPGADEDAQGKGFVGRAGRTLHKLLEEYGLRRGYEYGCANIVLCRPPDNRRPTMQEIVHCLPLLAETIDRAQPRAVITVGETATRGITGIVGLWVNIKALREHGHDPRIAEMICPPEIKPVWPHGSLLVPIPHTSPLAWNRNAPDGRKWAEVGAEQIRRMVEML